MPRDKVPESVEPRRSVLCSACQSAYQLPIVSVLVNITASDISSKTEIDFQRPFSNVLPVDFYKPVNTLDGNPPFNDDGNEQEQQR